MKGKIIFFSQSTVHSISFFGVKEVKHESYLPRNPHPIRRLAWLAWLWGVGGLTVGGLSPALCALSHTIFSSLCWLFIYDSNGSAVEID
jgi:hypothetical protein